MEILLALSVNSWTNPSIGGRIVDRRKVEEREHQIEVLGASRGKMERDCTGRAIGNLISALAEFYKW